MGRRLINRRLPSLRTTEERNELVTNNIGLAYKEANVFTKNGRGKPWYLHDDACADAILGLIRACELWDPARKVKLSTYSHSWIRQAMFIGLTRAKMIHKPRKYATEAIVTHLDLAVCNPTAPEQDLDAPISSRERAMAIDWAMSYVSSRAAVIMWLRSQGHGLQEIAVDLGITKERVRQIQEETRIILADLLRDWSPVQPPT